MTENKSFRKKALHIAWEMSPGVRLSYLSDSKEQTSYMVITSKSTSDLGIYVTQLMDTHLDFFTPDELLEEVTSARTSKAKGLALIRSGIGAPEHPTKPYGHVFFEAMRSSSPSVRLSGITAIGYAEWSEFLELLDAVSVEDDDKDVRSHAKSMANAFRKAARGAE
ncbi:hypothetical protein [Streptomyces sp. PSAA01]|uniref:hypothetical protein n=1 Tax=Streptomyces sp. PSAA01 TaxID=2912762 RepID=UPI001F31056C|nr:hypothetical protein [Streptomyces sp. PSAA01]MCG0285317.1 hypothetical protein [Streptomyces sp. PSAA01]